MTGHLRTTSARSLFSEATPSLQGFQKGGRVSDPGKRKRKHLGCGPCLHTLLPRIDEDIVRPMGLKVAIQEGILELNITRMLGLDIGNGQILVVRLLPIRALVLALNVT